MKIMKKIFCIAAAVLALVSCQSKSGSELYQGNYSFKTSGSLTLDVTGHIVIDGVNTDIDEEISFDLLSEMGQMDIIPVNDRSSELKITMNILGGDVYTADAAVGEHLSVTSFERKVVVNVRGVSGSIPVKVTGYADKYDNTIIFKLVYTGSRQLEGDVYSLDVNIVNSDVRCVAKLNK